MDINYSKEIRRFYWNNHTYLLRENYNMQELELIVFLGTIPDIYLFSKIEESIQNKENILSFLETKNIPEFEYRYMEKILLYHTW